MSRSRRPAAAGRLAALAAAALLLAACTSKPPRAPVVERAPEPVVARPSAGAPGTHTVRRGETLFSIAQRYGIGLDALARWNGIDDPTRLRVGQVLRLSAPGPIAETPAQPPAEAPADAGAVARPLETAPLPPGPGVAVQPLPPAEGDARLKTSPKAVRVPWSEEAAAKLKPVPPDGVTAEAPTEARPDGHAGDKPEDRVPWTWPTTGKVIAAFTDGNGSKGMQIAGKIGQPVYASAAGRVVYSGSGLRGYGNLVIIKHNQTYLSAYAHNNALLVKEGESVTRGQKIAEMGNSDTDRVKLHFEIRRLGKPVDPSRYLPPRP